MILTHSNDCYIKLSANAKVNLYLDVTAKRSNGYHDIETVMHEISLCDYISIEKLDSSEIKLVCSDSNIPCDESNTVYKACKYFLEYIKEEQIGFKITIEKQIPSQAGLGGGSSNAAAVIIGLDKLMNSKLSIKEMTAIGLKVGADVPFCIVGGCAYCTGIGEIITPLPSFKGYVAVAKGKTGISTKLAYEKIDMLGYNPKSDVYSFFSSSPTFKELNEYCKNIFEDVSVLNEISDIKNIML